MTPTMTLRAALAAAGILLGPSPSFARVIHIAVQSLSFGTMPTDARVGDVIAWDNQDIVDHTATAQDRSFDTELPAGETSRTVLRKAGTIRITCRYHPKMSAVLVIRN